MDAGVLVSTDVIYSNKKHAKCFSAGIFFSDPSILQRIATLIYYSYVYVLVTNDTGSLSKIDLKLSLPQ